MFESMFQNAFIRFSLVLFVFALILWQASSKNPISYRTSSVANELNEEALCTSPMDTISIGNEWSYRLGTEIKWPQVQSSDVQYKVIKGSLKGEDLAILQENPRIWFRSFFPTTIKNACRPISLLVPPIGGAFELYLNGVLLGKPEGDDVQLTVPHSRQPIHISLPNGILAAYGEENSIYIHKFAFSEARGYTVTEPGQFQLIDNQNIKKPLGWFDFVALFSPLFLLLIGLQQLVVWVLRPAQRNSFYFFIYSVSCAWITTPETPLIHLMSMDGATFVHLSWLGVFFNTLSFLLFLHAQFDLKTPLWMWTPAILFSSFGVIGLFSSDAQLYEEIFNKTYLLFYPALAHIAWVFFRAIAKRDPSAFWILGAIPIVLLLATVELLTLRSGNSGTEIIQFGFLIMGVTILFTMSRTNTSQMEQLEVQAIDLEKRVKARTQDLEETIIALKNRNEDLGTMARTLAHDLRSPLSTIKTLSDVLLDEEKDTLSDDANQTVGHIQSSTDRLMFLLDGLKSLATVGRDQHPKAEIDINQIVDDVTVLLDKEINDLNAQVHVEDNLPKIQGYPSDITALMLNLIQNAIQHHPGPEPQVWIRALPGYKTSALPFGRPSLMIAVEDDGKGIPEGQKRSIFHPFAKGKLHENQGQGIGLSVAQRVMDHIEGRIWVEDRAPQGARFCIAFPITADLTNPDEAS